MAFIELAAGLRQEGKGAAPSSDADVIKGGETARVEFNSSLLCSCRREKKDKEITGAAMRAVAAFLNKDGGTVYVGVGDDGEILGLGADYGCMSKRRDWDEWSQSFVNALNEVGKDFAEYVSHERI